MQNYSLKKTFAEAEMSPKAERHTDNTSIYDHVRRRTRVINYIQVAERKPPRTADTSDTAYKSIKGCLESCWKKKRADPHLTEGLDSSKTLQ